MKTKFFSAALMLCVLLGIARAQEAKPQRFEFGVDAGVSGYVNYSAISLMQDAESTYANAGYGIRFGWLKGHNMIGLHLKAEGFNTSATSVNEIMIHWALSAVYRYYMPIGNRFEVFAGAKLGASFRLSTFDYLNNHYSANRWGGICDFDLGVNCKLSEKSHIGICWTAASFESILGDSKPLPTGLTANIRNTFSGFGVMMQYGLRF